MCTGCRRGSLSADEASPNPSKSVRCMAPRVFSSSAAFGARARSRLVLGVAARARRRLSTCSRCMNASCTLPFGHVAYRKLDTIVPRNTTTLSLLHVSFVPARYRSRSGSRLHPHARAAFAFPSFRLRVAVRPPRARLPGVTMCGLRLVCGQWGGVIKGDLGAVAPLRPETQTGP